MSVSVVNVEDGFFFSAYSYRGHCFVLKLFLSLKQPIEDWIFFLSTSLGTCVL